MPRAAPLRPYGPDDLRETMPEGRPPAALRPFSVAETAVARRQGAMVRRAGGLVIDTPRLTETGGRARLDMAPGGQPLFVEADVPLAPAIEAPLTAFAAHAFALGRPLVATAPVDASFANHLEGVAALLSRWHAWPLPAPALEAPLLTETLRPAPGRALFFTCGVDSFFSLQRQRSELDHLVHAIGFDFALDDAEGHAAMAGRIGAVADALGLRVVSVRTNLRQHGLFQSLGWQVTHVAALAFLAHPLRLSIGSFRNASSILPPPHASHPTLDPLWGSSGTKLATEGYPTRRLDKVAAIAGWDLVHRHLQICWRKRPGAGNCGVCEKCVSTSVEFAIAGALPRMQTLPQDGLVGRVAALGPVPPQFILRWVQLAAEMNDPGLRAAAEDLVARSHAAKGWRSRVAPLVPRSVQRAIRAHRAQRSVWRHWPRA